MENVDSNDSKLSKKFQFELEREKIRNDSKLEIEKEKSKFQLALTEKQAEIEKEKSKFQLALAEKQAEIERIKSDSQKEIADIQSKLKLEIEVLKDERLRKQELEGRDIFSLADKREREKERHLLYRRIFTFIAILICIITLFILFKD